MNGVEAFFDINTGAGISAVSEQVYESNLKHLPIEKEVTSDRGYSGESFKFIGVLNSEIKFNGCGQPVKLFVIKNGGPPILY